MSDRPLSALVNAIRERVVPDLCTDDAQLLTAHLNGDRAAFARLVQSHSALVWGVCSRVLTCNAEAEDAFQATFLILLEKAETIDRTTPLAPWLYRVASRVAMKCRLKKWRREKRESLVARSLRNETKLESAEIHNIIDEEVQRLSEGHRQVIVMCYFEGQTCEQAAEQLRCARGTILSRLARAREQLRNRLIRRGIDGATATMPTGILLNTTIPQGLTQRFLDAALSQGTSGFSTETITLARGVIATMMLGQRGQIGLICLVLILATSGVGFFAGLGAQQPAKEKTPPIRRVEKPPAVIPPKEEKKVTTKRISKEGSINDLLNQSMEFQFEGKAPLKDVLEILSKRASNLTIVINRRAFKEEGVEDIEETPISGFPTDSPTNPLKASLNTILKAILNKISTNSQAIYLVRDGYIEITTVTAGAIELGFNIDYSQNDYGLGSLNLPTRLVNAEFENVPLNKALFTLGKNGQLNVIIDQRLGEKAQTNITAAFTNAHAETACELLIDMVDLGSVKLDNILYVTSKENAKRLEQRQKTKQAKN